jgi:cell division protein FtsQ
MAAKGDGGLLCVRDGGIAALAGAFRAAGLRLAPASGLRRQAMPERVRVPESVVRGPRDIRGPKGPIARLERMFPRGFGTCAAVAFMLASVAYGVAKGGHAEAVGAELAEIRDAAANTIGFGITSIALTGEKQLTREEILNIAGISGRNSLLFLDADAARARLKANPWIEDATILKLFPDRLHISVTERSAFALWQKDGRVRVISRDGAMVQPFAAPQLASLPLVVGNGANLRAAEFLTVMDQYPELRDQVHAYVLVADRRWNLRLKNGMDIRLPEEKPGEAIAALIELDRDKKLLSRDILAVDMRIPDRVTVRLSDEAAAARAEAIKDKLKKRKGGDA